MKARIDQILETFRQFVISREHETTPILSVYVDVNPADPDNQRERPAWLIALKNEAKKLEETLDPEELKRRDVQRKWSQAEAMVMEYLRERKPTGRSVVLFSDLNDFIAVDIPVPVDTRLYFGLPQLKHLLFALDQYKKYLVILVSGAEFRLIEVFLMRSGNELRVETKSEISGEGFGRKARTQAWERRGLEFERRFVRDVASDVDAYFLGDPDCERIVLGGNLKQAQALSHALHPMVRERVVDIAPIDYKLPIAEIAERVSEMAGCYEEEHDVAVVETLVTLTNRRGAAVLEKQAVETALQRGNVRTLVIPYPLPAEEFDALIVDATVRGADIEFVYGAAAKRLHEFGGIGATLYYSDR